MSTEIVKEASAEEIDEAFENGDDMRKYFDFSAGKMKYLNKEMRRVNINMPVWLIEAIDAEAAHMGANRQSYINMNLAEKVRKEHRERIA